MMLRAYRPFSLVFFGLMEVSTPKMKGKTYALYVSQFSHHFLSAYYLDQHPNYYTDS